MICSRTDVTIIIIIIINVDFKHRDCLSTGRASAANAVGSGSKLVYSTGDLFG